MPAEPTPSVVEYRWIVPRVIGPAFQHASIVDAPFTLCRAHHTEGAIYPPASGVPQCPSCAEEVAREKKADGNE